MRLMKARERGKNEPRRRSAGAILAGVVICLGFAPPASAIKANWSITRDISPPKVQRSLSSPAIAHSKKALHIVFKDNHIFYMRSLDGGRTWSYPVRISGPNLSNGAPAIFADEDAIHVAYPAQVTEIDTRYFQLFYTQSTDNGETFSKPVRLTDTQAQVRTPRFLPLRQGIAIFYYEVESISVYMKDALDISFFERLEEKPLTPVIKREELSLLRSTIKMIKSEDAGRTFSLVNRVADRGKLIDNFVAYMGGEGILSVSFEEEGRYLTLESHDEGETWKPNYDRIAFFSQWEIADLVYMDGDLHKVWIPVDPGRKVAVWYQDISTGEDSESISEAMLVSSPPRLVVGGNEIYVVWSASTEGVSRLAYQRTDHASPKSILVRPTDPDLDADQVEFAWTGEDNLSETLYFSYRFTGDEWSPFSPSQEFIIQSPPDGEYVFELQAKDEAGNLEPEPLVFAFNTYKVPPNTFFLETPPDPVAAREVNIEWSGSDNTETAEQLLYSYSWDGGTWTEFSPQRSAGFGPLKETDHQLLVRSKDRQGNIDPEPEQCSFFVDLGMTIAFVTPPPPWINSSQLQLSWQGTDQTGEEPRFLYAIQRDDEPWTPFRDMQSMKVTNLAQGPHTIRIKAQDIVGNESNVLEHQVVVDYEPPVVYAQLDFIDKTQEGLPVISLGGEDNLTPETELQFEYRIVGEEWSPAEGRTVTIARPIKWYSPGYVVEVIAKDEVGNMSPSVEVSLRFFDRLQRNRGQLYALAGASLGFICLLVLLAVYFVIQRRKLTLETEEEKEEEPTAGLGEEEEFTFGEPAVDELELGETSEDEDDLFT